MGNDKASQTSDSPLIPASQSLPEITIRVIVLGFLLTVILAAANAYLGLKVGQTISASIPAAIISMSILRFFRNSNMLENTMVQTMASVGEALIAGIAYILPALIILHAWESFYYWETVLISLLGGILGVLFTIPLRRALLKDRTLRYPEGVAISNVLKASSVNEKSDLVALALGGLVGSLISLFQTGFQILSDTFDYWVRPGGKTIVGLELGFSPALIAAGYIVGINVAISFLVGIVIGWIIGMPILSSIFTTTAPAINDSVMEIYRAHTRFIGVGTMLVGAFWTLITLVKPIVQSIYSSFATLRAAKLDGAPAAIRTERDIPINYVFWLVIFMLLPIFLLIASFIPHDSTSALYRYSLAGFGAIYVVVGGFLFCSISAYFAGLIGSSNTPVSGLVVSALLILCLCILLFFGFESGGVKENHLLGVIVGIGCCVIIGVGVAISNDTMQDLKVGQVLGATPWKQQLMLVIGVIASSFVVPPIFDLLYNAYGIGGVFPHPGMNKAQMLAAPQAAMMASVAQGVYEHNLPWLMLAIGAFIAAICIVIDETLKRHGHRLPVLGVGLAIYLPMNTTIPVVIGGLLSYLINTRLDQVYKPRGENEAKIATHKHRGLLLACGIVAGASIMGVVLAIPFAIKQSSDALKIMPDEYIYLAGSLSLVVTMVMLTWIYRFVMRKN